MTTNSECSSAEDAGFAMVETLLALVLTAFMSSAIIAVLWQASAVSAEAAARARAILIAKAAWSAPCDWQTAVGQDRFDVTVTRFAAEQDTLPGMVEVNVSWSTANRERTLQLRGVRSEFCTSR